MKKKNQLTNYLLTFFVSQYFYVSETPTHGPALYHGANKNELKINAK